MSSRKRKRGARFRRSGDAAIEHKPEQFVFCSHETQPPATQTRRHRDWHFISLCSVSLWRLVGVRLLRRMRTRRTRADIAQELPGVIAFAMSVVPMKAKSVLAHGFGFHGAHGRAKPSQIIEAHRTRRARQPALGRAPGRTSRARTDGAQVREAVVAAMPVLPFDLDTGAGCDLHLRPTWARRCETCVGL